MGHRRFRMLAFLISAMCLPLQSSATGIAPNANVAVTAILCTAKVERSANRHGEVPHVYLDSAQPLAQKLVRISLGRVSLTLEFAAAPGFHHLFLISPYGSSTIQFDKLANHPRALTVSLCSSLVHFDQAPSVTLVLPPAALAPYLLIHSDKVGDTFQQMSVEGDVAYATSIPLVQ
jgi:hypothetical protein